ncbi:MAG TPA: hypothetical protein VIS05_01335 [Ilumatobacter sp.]
MTMWILVVLIVLMALAGVAWAVRRRTAGRRREADALSVFGTVLAGTSAVLVATIGTAAFVLTIIGVACIAVGNRRSRTRRS